jgi:hypothetical protein
MKAMNTQNLIIVLLSLVIFALLVGLRHYKSIINRWEKVNATNEATLAKYKAALDASIANTERLLRLAAPSTLPTEKP